MMKSLLPLAAVMSLTMVVAAPAAMAKPHHGHKAPVFQKFAKVPLPVIRQKLRRHGYKRIVFTDRQLPVYQAKACKNGKRFALRLNRKGGMIARYRIGRCFG